MAKSPYKSAKAAAWYVGNRIERRFNMLRCFGETIEMVICDKDNKPIDGALIDYQDAPTAGMHRWCRHTAGYCVSRINGKLVFLHRFIMNAQPGQMIDHINHDKMDNRRSNLRFVDNSQNVWNQSMKKNNHSGVRGVHWSKAYKYWVAQIGVRGKTLALGCFPYLEDAIKARKDAEIIYHGEYRYKEKEEICQ